MATERTQLHRKAQRGSHDRAVIDAIVDEALVCHVAIAAEHGPIVIPTTHVRIGDSLYIHGAVANAMMNRVATGAPACVAITLLDALVLSRTAFHHSVNYRSVIVFGSGRRVEAADEKRAAFAALIDKVVPGRSKDCRMPDDKELRATQIIALPLTEASAKIRTGPPLPEAPADAGLPYWRGIIPLSIVRGEPIED